MKVHINCPRMGGESISSSRCPEIIWNTTDPDLFAQCQACPHGQELAALSTYQRRDVRDEEYQKRLKQALKESPALEFGEALALSVAAVSTKIGPMVPVLAVVDEFNRRAKGAGLMPVKFQTVWRELGKLGIPALPRRVQWQGRPCKAISLRHTANRQALGLGV